MGLSSFVQLLGLLPPKHEKCREIPTEFDLTAVQGHPRSSILVSMESPRGAENQSLPSAKKYNFYRSMYFSAKRGIAIACHLYVYLSICPSVSDVGGL